MSFAVRTGYRVIRAGAQGAPGVTGPAGGTLTAENQSGGTLAAGTAVAVAPSGPAGVIKAVAGATARPAVGVAAASTAAGASGTVLVGGTLTLADWSGVATAALTPGALYFVDPATPGRLTATAPAAVGQTVQAVGRAVKSDTLLVEVDDPVLL